MPERVGIIFVMCLLAAGIVGCRQKESPAKPPAAEPAAQPVQAGQKEALPPIWERIEQEADAYAAALDAITDVPPHSREAKERLAGQWQAAVAEVVRCYGRDAIIPLGPGFAELRDRSLTEQREDHLARVVSFAADVVKLITRDAGHDPRFVGWPRALFPGLAYRRQGHELAQHTFSSTAALVIDLHDDQWARDALLAVSLEGSNGLGLLRAYEGEHVRPKIQAALPELDRLGEQDLRAAGRAAVMRSLLASYDYADRLDEPTREQYRSFERRLWRALILAPWVPSGSRKAYLPWNDAARTMVLGKGTLVAGWQDGDEQFVLRIFQEPTSTPMELLVAVRLGHKLSPQARQQLTEIAESDSPHARYARPALQRHAALRSNIP